MTERTRRAVPGHRRSNQRHNVAVNTLNTNAERWGGGHGGELGRPGHRTELASLADIDRQWREVAPAWNYDRAAYDRHVGRLPE